jgi:ubiquitin-conjugating enzyme E2 G2
VYKDGRVCISILHPPGDDPNQYELASERWSPIQSIEKIILSVMSLLADSNDESPANVGVAKLRRETPDLYTRLCREQVKVFLGLQDPSTDLLRAMELH